MAEPASTKGFSRKRSNFTLQGIELGLGMPQRRASLGREAIAGRAVDDDLVSVASTKGFSRKRSNHLLPPLLSTAEEASTKGFSRKRSN